MALELLVKLLLTKIIWRTGELEKTVTIQQISVPLQHTAQLY